MNITLPKTLSKIGNGVFQNCPKLTEIDLTDIAVIGEKAFSGCTALQNVLFGNRITYLANAIFLGCTSLTEIILPENIAYIGCECFKDCTSLTAIKYDGVMEIAVFAILLCRSHLHTYRQMLFLSVSYSIQLPFRTDLSTLTKQPLTIITVSYSRRCSFRQHNPLLCRTAISFTLLS